MDSYYVEVQPVPFKERIKRRGGFFIWKISAPLVGAVIMGFYTQSLFIFFAIVSLFAFGISVNLYFFIKVMKFYLISLKIDSFNKVYLTFDLKGETKMESYELKDFNLLVEEKRTRHINITIWTMTLINQSKKIHVQHEIGDWDKEKYFEVSKAVSDLKSQ